MACTTSESSGTKGNQQMSGFRVLLCLVVLNFPACSPGDPLVGEFSGQLVGDTRAKKDEVARFRVAKEGQHYHLSIWHEPSKAWRDAPAVLDPCPPEVLSGFLGEKWKELNPVGACAKGLMLFHARSGDSIPSLKTSGYALVLYMAFGGGGVFDLHKVK
jgi:hypothetical protein